MGTNATELGSDFTDIENILTRLANEFEELDEELLKVGKFYEELNKDLNDKSNRQQFKEDLETYKKSDEYKIFNDALESIMKIKDNDDRMDEIIKLIENEDRGLLMKIISRPRPRLRPTYLTGGASSPTSPSTSKSAKIERLRRLLEIRRLDLKNINKETNLSLNDIIQDYRELLGMKPLSIEILENNMDIIKKLLKALINKFSNELIILNQNMDIMPPKPDKKTGVKINELSEKIDIEAFQNYINESHQRFKIQLQGVGTTGLNPSVLVSLQTGGSYDKFYYLEEEEFKGGALPIGIPIGSLSSRVPCFTDDIVKKIDNYANALERNGTPLTPQSLSDIKK